MASVPDSDEALVQDGGIRRALCVAPADIHRFWGRADRAPDFTILRVNFIAGARFHFCGVHCEGIRQSFHDVRMCCEVSAGGVRGASLAVDGGALEGFALDAGGGLDGGARVGFPFLPISCHVSPDRRSISIPVSNPEDEAA